MDSHVPNLKIEFYEDSCYETKYSGENSKGKVINWVGMYDRQVEYITTKYIGMKLVIDEKQYVTNNKSNIFPDIYS